MTFDRDFATQLLIGNLSYILLIASMMMTRMTTLRLIAIGSGASGAAYHFLCVSDPLGAFWESAFTLVNIAQLALAAYHNATARFSGDERAFCEQIVPALEPHQVRRLLRVASWIEFNPGSELLRQRGQVSHLPYVRSGQASVLVDGRLVGRVPGPGHLISAAGRDP